MKKLLILTSLMITSLSFAQRELDYNLSGFVLETITPSLTNGLEQTSIAGNTNAFAAWINKPIESKHDNFDVGGGYIYKKENNYHNLGLHIGRKGSNNDKWRMTMVFGYVQVNSIKGELTKQGEQFKPRTSTYGGASLFYYHSDNTFIGFSVPDVYDVGIALGDDKTFAKYEGMTPTVITQVCLFDDNWNKINLYADVSYHTEQKFTYTVNAQFATDDLKVNAFYSNNLGISTQYSFDWLAVYASQTVTGVKETSIGIRFQ